MILQYENQRRDWVYEEADKIECSLIDFKDLDINIGTFNNKNLTEYELNEIYSLHISNVLNCSFDGTNIFADSLSGIPTLTVVTLTKLDKVKVYAFIQRKVYMLNDSGKTINKIL